MSIDKSLKRRASLARQRSVLTRGERIAVLQEQDRWQEGRSPYGLPKVRVQKLVLKKAKKAKAEEATPTAAGGEAKVAAAPAKDAKKK